MFPVGRENEKWLFSVMYACYTHFCKCVAGQVTRVVVVLFITVIVDEAHLMYATMVQNNQESQRKYWATCSFARTARPLTLELVG